MICIEYSKTHEDLRVLMRYLVLLHCLTEYQKRLEFPLRQGGYDDVFISNLIIFYNKLHFVDIVDINDYRVPSPVVGGLRSVRQRVRVHRAHDRVGSLVLVPSD